MNEMRKATPSADATGAAAKPIPAAPRTVAEGAPAPSPRPPASRAPFRSRLFAILLLFAVVPSIAITLGWMGTARRALPLVGATSAWERVGFTGERALSALADADLTASQRAVLTAHEQELRRSVELAKRFGFMVPRTVQLVGVGALVLIALVGLGASRVAGHLARQLSRPLDELVGWTRLIRAGAPLPVQGERRGAPEFEVLRTDMRNMATELEQGRRRALDAERAEAFRESARRFAHELKNPLTPIRFAVDRLRRGIPPELEDTVEVLAEESARLESMARAFAQFGRLPDGPPADVDVGDLVTRAARHTVADGCTLVLEVEPNLPLVFGYHEAIVRAISNVLINAVEVCRSGGTITVRVFRDQLDDERAVTVAVRDTGPGIAPDKLARIFDPYVTTKPGGTGLGLAIAQQTVHAHHGVVEATSEPGAGTEIRLRFPVSGARALTPTTPRSTKELS